MRARSDDVLLGFLSAEAGGILALLGSEPDYGWGSTVNGGHRPQSFFLGTAGFGEEGSPGWVGTHLFDLDILSDEVSIGIGNWRAEGNVYDIFKDLLVR
jgi:hypothetical protein